MLLRRLPGCTCPGSAAWRNLHSTASSSSQHASTSATKIEDMARPQSTDPPTFESLLPRGDGSMLRADEVQARSSSGKVRKQRRLNARTLRRMSLGEHSTRRQADEQAAMPSSTSSTPSQISPYLPLVTRERSHLLSSLRSSLYSRSPSPSHSSSYLRAPLIDISPSLAQSAAPHSRADPDATWAALARLLRYPDLLPEDMPHTSHPTSARVQPIDYDDESGHHGEGRDGRTKIPLSLAELRRAFTIFASARPRTREGLDRLLVVAELLALQSRTRSRSPSGTFSTSRNPTASSTTAATTAPPDDASARPLVRELTGAGAGLREQDWRALILFVGAHLRAPRSTVEVDSAFALFGQFLSSPPPASVAASSVRQTRQTRQKRRGEGHQAATPATVQAQVETYNALLHVARRARSWELFNQLEQRMDEVGLGEGNVETAGIRMVKEDQRGAHIESVWNVLVRALEADPPPTARATTRLWEGMLWIYARRGMMREAMKIYDAMKDGQSRRIGSLAPPRFDLVGDEGDDTAEFEDASTTGSTCSLSQPSIAVYTSLIQAFSHRGELTSALSVLRDMVMRSSTSSSAPLPTPRIFAFLFRGFALYGQSPSAAQTGLPSRLLRRGGSKESFGSPARRGNALATTRDDTFSPLLALDSKSSSSEATRTSSQPWSLSTLDTLLESFLALSPPTLVNADSSHPQPFNGRRTAPSSKELFWLILAYEVLTDADSRVVLNVWDAVETTFSSTRRESDADGLGKASRPGQPAWTGWRVDRRLRDRIRAHAETVAREEEEERLERERDLE